MQKKKNIIAGHCFLMKNNINTIEKGIIYVLFKDPVRTVE